MMGIEFSTVRRQQFRRYFQPSRVLLGIFPAKSESGFNVITLCFSMYCSYRPPMIAVAVNDHSATFGLIHDADEFVLSVPGPSLVNEAIQCGIHSMEDVDKIKQFQMELVASETVSVPGLRKAIANVELRKSVVIPTGDHVILVGEAIRFAVNTLCGELPLLSIGPFTDGYKLLQKRGIHRLGVVSGKGNTNAGGTDGP